MHRHKRFIAALALLLTVSVFTACSNSNVNSKNGGEQGDGGEQKVTLSMIFQESLFNGSHEEIFKEYTDANPNVTIKAETIPDGSYNETMRTRLSTGEVPDLYQAAIHATLTDDLEREGYIQDLKDLAPVQNYSESIQQATRDYGDKQVIFSIGVGVLGIAYNKAMLAEVGYNEPPKTWEELMDAGKKLKDNGKDLLVYSSKWATGIGNVFHWAFGVNASKDAAFKEAYLSKSVDWSKPENRAVLVDGFTKFNELNQYVRTGSFTNEYAIAQQAFANGEAAMILGGTWEAGALRGLNQDLDLGFMNLPYAPEDQNAYVLVPEDGISVNAKSENLEEAKKFIGWLFSKETYAKVQKAKGNFSAMPGVGDIDPSYTEVPGWMETDRVITFANSGPIEEATWLTLGNLAQEFTFKNNLDKVVDNFISEYNKMKK
ncbi:ABC transporter substrate-binding protein [Paenibacillus spongiae]|uniref:Extracellular solute-binding protein n=1 Tax=Paenibacillus spongiae TaxID=2909671 RepID=A0ABY5S8J6_9BACL|nr:extracellular solute-binding protein [Paenibacillus spongiae]UVI29999.1 extracellular solute-binding protein [Paenibacillus spongiae]